MKYQSFIMRVLCLLLIVGVVLGYNSMQKKDSDRSEEHTSELQSPYVIAYAVFCLKKLEEK